MKNATALPQTAEFSTQIQRFYLSFRQMKHRCSAQTDLHILMQYNSINLTYVELETGIALTELCSSVNLVYNIFTSGESAGEEGNLF